MKYAILTAIAVAGAAFAETAYEYRTNDVSRVVHVYEINTNGVNRLVRIEPLPPVRNTNTVFRITK